MSRQKELFPEQPKEVEGLVKDIAVTNEQMNALEKSYRDSKDAFYYKRSSLWQRLREICVHPEIRIEHDHDYHNNIDWDLHICTTCEKQLKKV